MNLDLNGIVDEWETPEGAVAARLVPGNDGAPVVQLRVDLGLLQMAADGRPDGERYRGFPSAFAYIEHEQRLEHDLDPEDWSALRRELTQLNYRRLALAALSEAALDDDQPVAELSHLERLLRDIRDCLLTLGALARVSGGLRGRGALLASLLFDQGRFAARLAVLRRDVEAAIEAAESGATMLAELLRRVRGGELPAERDPGVLYLRQLGQRLRSQFGMKTTLREQLSRAIEAEDFEAAARLRDGLVDNPALPERVALDDIWPADEAADLAGLLGDEAPDAGPGDWETDDSDGGLLEPDEE